MPFADSRPVCVLRFCCVTPFPSVPSTVCVETLRLRLRFVLVWERVSSVLRAPRSSVELRSPRSSVELRSPLLIAFVGGSSEARGGRAPPYVSDPQGLLPASPTL